MKFTFALAFILLTLLTPGCGEDDIITDGADQEEDISLLEDETEEPEEIEIELPEPDIPQPIAKALDRLEQGMEGKDTELYLEAFWADDYSYHSDMTTDDPLVGDDVMFDDIEEERDSVERLFAEYKSFDVEFGTKEFTEVSAVEYEVRSHYRLLVSIKDGKSLPGGYKKMFAEGENIFTLKKRGNEWRISHWEQEEMSPNEIMWICDKKDICPPEDALLNVWGALKAER